MIIVFLIDTSWSMGRPTASGTSYLDVAKMAVGKLCAVRSLENLPAAASIFRLSVLSTFPAVRPFNPPPQK